MATPFRLKRSSISGKRPSLSDLQLGELALNFYDGYLFAERDTGGVGIATTIALLTPWTENFGAGSIHYLNSVAIGKENPTGSLDVVGHTELDNLNVSGIATIATLGLSGDIDVDGHTTLDNVSISGVTTIFNTTDNVLGDSNTGALQIDGGLGVDKNVTVGGNLDVQGYSNFVGVVTFRGGTINLGDANTDDINIGGEFVSDLVPDATNLYSLGTPTKQWKDLYIDGTADVDALTVSGVSTFTGAIDANGDLDVDGHTELDNLNVSGVSTFVGLINANDGLYINNSNVDIDINGAKLYESSTRLRIDTSGGVTIRGGGTAATLASFNYLGSADLYYNNSKKFETTNKGIDVTGHTETDTLNVSGVSTFVGAIDANGDLDVDGHTELDNVRITGVSTFTSPLDINTDVDIDGHTDLDNVVIAGIATFQSDALFGDADYIQMGDAQDLKIGHVGSYSVILDQGEGNLSIGGDGFVDIMNTALDEYKARFITNGAVELYWDNSKKLETTGYGVTVYNTLRAPQLNITGVSTYEGNADFNANVDIFGTLDVDGHTELDNLNVSGVSTFASNVDINADIDVDGHTNLDNVDIAGVTTTSGLLDINAGGQANTFIVEDLTDNRVVIVGPGGELEDDGNLTFDGSTLSIGVDLDVDGHTELDNVAISGVTTFSGAIDANGDLDVDGHTELDNLNVSGVSTFASDVDVNANVDVSGYLDVDGHTELDNVNVSGVSTFVGIGTFNSDLFVGGDLNVIGNVVYTQASATNLVITGVSTFGGQIDANGDLDVDGHTELDNVNISGVTTTSGLLDINAGGQANTFKVEDLTDNRVVIAGTGGELEDDANLTFDGSTLVVGVNLDVDGHTELDNVAISGVTTFTGNIDANGDLDVDGTTELDILNVAETATFSSNIDANGDLDVDGHTELDNLRVSGVSTFVSSVNINTDIDVDGHTELDNVNISGVTTTSGLLDINANGQANSFKVEDLTNDRIVIAGTGGELEDDANLTFNGTQLFVGVDLDVDGHTELDNVNVSGMATVESLHVSTDFDVYDTQAVFHSDLYVAGNLSIGGTTTVLQAQDLKIFDKDIILGVTTDSNGNDISTDDTANHGGVAVASTEGNPLVDLRIVGIETLPATYKKIMWFKEGAFAGLGTDAWLINYAVGIGSTQFPTGTRLAVGGIQFTEDTIVTPNITISEDLSITGDLDVDGHTNLDNISVAGVTTFAGNIDANGNLDVDGHTDLDNVDIAGVTTTSGLLDINAGGQANTFKVEDLTDNRIVLAGTGGELEDDANLTFDGSLFSVGTAATFTSGNVYIDDNLFVGGIEITGGASIGLDITTRNLDVTGIATFASTLDANGNVDIAGTLDVDGHTELDNVAISGVTTFSGAVDANANVDIAGILDVDGHTELDNVAISGVTTFSGYLDANANVGVAGNLDVDGHTDLDNVSISGVTTFTGAIDADGNVDVAGTLDVDGHTELDNVNISGVATATEFVGPLTGNVTGTATTATKIATSTGGSETDYYVMLALNAGGDNYVRLDSGIKYNTPTDTLTLGGDTIVGAGLSVVGVSTFTGEIDANGRIVGAATSNVIPFLYSTMGDLPNAGTYHGAFAHVHNQGKGYFAHGGNWYELVNKELNGTVGTGTERYDIGYIDATGSNVTGVSTAATSQAATLNVGAGGTVLTASVDTSKVGINSTAPAYALDVVGDINSSTDIKVNGVSIVVSGTPASTDDVVALAIALG